MRKPPGDLGGGSREAARRAGVDSRGKPRLQGVVGIVLFRRHEARRTQGRRLSKIATRFRVRTPATAMPAPGRPKKPQGYTRPSYATERGSASHAAAARAPGSPAWHRPPGTGHLRRRSRRWEAAARGPVMRPTLCPDCCASGHHCRRWRSQVYVSKVVGPLSADIPRRSASTMAPEFVSKELDPWAYMKGVTLDFSQPGKPTDNAFIESFNGKFRAECLNANWFLSLDEARA
jgi:transposase InsO family protein